METAPTLQGAYNYKPDLFDDFDFPNNLDPDILKSMLIQRSAVFELIYNDLNLLKLALAWWSRSRRSEWEKIAAALTEKYNALYNLDVSYEREETRKKEGTESSKGTTAGTQTQQTSSTNTQNGRHKVYGYNSSSGTDASEDINNGTGSGTAAADSKETRSGSATRSEDEMYKIIEKRYGNQGVTMSQQMINAEIDLRAFSIYDYIADEFIERFCIMVY